MSSEKEKLLSYVGIPYVHLGRGKSGVDCWGLVTRSFKEIRNIKLFDLEMGYTPNWHKNGENLFRKFYHHNWKRLDRENKKLFDLVLFKDRDGIANHVGIIVDRWQFIHAIKFSGVVLSRIDDREWKDKIEGFYRYKDNGYTQILSNKI